MSRHATAALAIALAACGASPAPEPPIDATVEAHSEPAPRPRAPRRARLEGPVDTSEVVGKGPFPASTNAGLLDPAFATATAPPEFRVLFRTSAGNFAVDCHRDWAPIGADRFYNLVQLGFYDDVAFFRVARTPQPFVAQFGIHGDPRVSAAWKDARLPADPVVHSNARGTLTFAMAGKADTRTTQLFLNLTDNERLDALGFAPVCAVADHGMDAVDKLYGGYGESPTREQVEMMAKGNDYLRATYPDLDYIATARVVPIPVPASAPPPAASTAPTATVAP
ncbi:MAG: peptidylprolyl isomerase [Polyangiaceae bacterium]